MTGGGDEVDRSEIGVCGVSLVGGDWQHEVVCEVMPDGTRRGLGVVFHWNGPDVIVQRRILGLEWEFPKFGRAEGFRGGGIPFGPPLPDEGQDCSDPLVMIEMPVGDDNVRYVGKFWVGYHGRLLESRFEDSVVVLPTLAGVHQDIRVVPPDEVGVRPYGIGEPSGDTPCFTVGLRTLQSQSAPVLGKEVSDQLPVINWRLSIHLGKNSNREIAQLIKVVRPTINLCWGGGEHVRG